MRNERLGRAVRGAIALGFLACWLLATGCGAEAGPAAGSSGEGGNAHGHAGHVHRAPNGGHLIPVLEGGANVEVAHDPEEGRLDLWFHDGCAERPLRMRSEGQVLVLEDGTELALRAVASPLSGETERESGHFFAQDASLQGPSLAGKLRGLVLMGAEVPPLPVRLPAEEEAH